MRGRDAWPASAPAPARIAIACSALARASAPNATTTSASSRLTIGRNRAAAACGLPDSRSCSASSTCAAGRASDSRGSRRCPAPAAAPSAARGIVILRRQQTRQQAQFGRAHAGRHRSACCVMRVDQRTAIRATATRHRAAVRGPRTLAIAARARSVSRMSLALSRLQPGLSVAMRSRGTPIARGQSRSRRLPRPASHLARPCWRRYTLSASACWPLRIERARVVLARPGESRPARALRNSASASSRCAPAPAGRSPSCRNRCLHSRVLRPKRAPERCLRLPEIIALVPLVRAQSRRSPR